MQSFPKPLSAKEELSYLKQCKAGDKEARDCLTLRNLRLVAYIAGKYRSSGVEMEDLISIGTIGLIKGLDSFQEKKNIRLATYCARCIENAILSQMRLYVSKKSPLVKSILVGGYLQNFQRIIFLCAKLKMVS